MENLQTQLTKKSSNNKTVLYFIILLILSVAALAGVYLWLQGKVTELREANTSLTSQLTLANNRDESDQTSQGVTGASSQSSDEAVITAAKNYCAAYANPDTGKAGVLQVGTTGRDQVKVAYSNDKNFASMNVTCSTAANISTQGSGIEYILKKVNGQWLVVTQRQQDNPEVNKLYAIPPELTQ